MSERDKPLPEPPGRKFGEKKHDTPVLADRIAEAMAGGKLDEFVKHEIPDSDEARALVSMMLGMTGMLPPGGLENTPEGNSTTKPASSAEKTSEETPAAAKPPEDMREAVRAGDMESLVDLLKREHGKRAGGAVDTGREEDAGGTATIGSREIDRLLSIASDNGLSPDWVILRAIRLYIREYERTGRL